MTGSMVGRYSELATISELVEEARRGRSSALFVEGDAGIGKTRLIQTLSERAEQLDMRVISAAAQEAERMLPYGVLGRALEEQFAELGPEGLATIAGDGWRLLGALFPSLADSAFAPDDRTRALVLLARVLVHLAERRPILLALDDVHWADDSTLDGIRVLAGRLGGSRCLLAVAYQGRPPWLSAQAATAFRTLMHEVPVTHVELRPLDEEDCGTLIAQTLGGAVDRDLVRRIFAVAKGNPFFTKEIIRALRRSGGVHEEAGTFEFTGGDARLSIVPDAEAVVLHRINALGNDALTVARGVSVLERLRIGGPTYEALVTATGLTETAVDAVLDELVRAGILTLEGQRTVEFAHPIVRAVLHEDVGPAARRAIHAATATALQAFAARGGLVSRTDIARHVVQVAAPGDAEAIDLLVGAAEEAVVRSPGTAADWYEDALRLVPPFEVDVRAHITARRARALFLADQLGEAIDSARDAIQHLSPGPDRISVVGVLVTGLIATGRSGEALKEIDRALATSDIDARGRLLAYRASALLYLGRVDESESCGRDALEAIGDDVTGRLLALRELAQAALFKAHLEDFRRLHTEALALAATRNPRDRILILALGGIRLASIGELAEASIHITEAATLCQEFGTRAFDPLVETGLALVDWCAGRWDDAVRRCSALMPEVVWREGVAGAGGMWIPLLNILIDRGEVSRSRALLAEVRRSFQATGSWLGLDYYLPWCESRLARVTGNGEAAILKLEKSREKLTEEGIFAACVVLVDIAGAYADIGRIDLAQQASDELEEFSRGFKTAFADACGMRARLYAYGDLEAGRAARDLLVEVGLPFEVACTELALGRAAGDAEILMGAYEAFQSLGAAPWKRRAAAALRKLGAPIPRRERRRSELSELETQIARLVCEGLANREIAAVLYISTKTVENNLSRIYAKTDCRSRAELVSIVARGGLNLG